MNRPSFTFCVELVGLLLLGCSCARSQASTAGGQEPAVDLAAPTASVTDRLVPDPEEVTITGGEYRMKGFVFRPAGQGRFPAIIYNHGSEREPSLKYERELGAWFQARDIAVLFPHRRGSLGSDGPYWADEVHKRRPEEADHATVDQLMLQVSDVVAAIEWVATQSFVDPSRVAIAGCSFGGIVSLLASERPTRARAVVDFAGGSMAWASSYPLQKRMSEAALAARVPVFFVQAENDFNTEPSLVLGQLMLDAGKPHQVEIFPPHGTTRMEGHAHFCNFGMGEWGDLVLDFLRRAWSS
jgi:dienelactone hydrolase